MLSSKSFDIGNKLTSFTVSHYLFLQYRTKTALLGTGISVAGEDLTVLVSGSLVSISSLLTSFFSTGLSGVGPANIFASEVTGVGIVGTRPVCAFGADGGGFSFESIGDSKEGHFASTGGKLFIFVHSIYPACVIAQIVATMIPPTKTPHMANVKAVPKRHIVAIQAY